MLSSVTKNLSSRITVKLILFFMLGIFCLNNFGLNCVNFFTVFLFVLFIVLSIYLHLNKSLKLSITLLVCIFAFNFGAYFTTYTNSHNQSDLASNIDKNYWYYGIVSSSPELSSKQTYFSVNVDLYQYEQNNQKLPISGKTKIFVKNWQNKFPQINDRIFFYTSLSEPDNFAEDFDYKLYLKTKNIYLTGFTNVVYLDSEVSYSLDFISKIKYWGRDINQYFMNKIDTVFSYDTDANSIVKGILLGNKDDFSQLLSENFSKTGISHITAVSGLHLNIIIGVICGLLGLFRIRRKYAGFLVLPLTFIFASIVGFTPSVCRAGIMLTMNMIAILFKRQYDALTSLFISALIILFFNPYSLFNISFILSFAATFSIIIFYSIISELIGDKNNFLLSSLMLSFSSFIGTAPFIAYYFNQISIASLVVNIWIIPLCSVILVLGFICLFLSFILPKFILNFVLYPLAGAIELIIHTTELSSSIPFAYFTVDSPSILFLLLYFEVIYLVFRILKKIQIK